MENNNTPRKARIFYKGESIPVLVEAEYDRNYELLLDWDDPVLKMAGAMQQEFVRSLYLDALFGYKDAHKNYKTVSTAELVLVLDKDNPEVTLEFVESEPEEAQGEPVDTTGIDDVPPPNDSHAELNQHLALLARSGYKVKSFDVSIQDSGEAHLCATFTKEVDK